jgi:hypothetical protein
LMAYFDCGYAVASKSDCERRVQSSQAFQMWVCVCGVKLYTIFVFPAS